MKRRWGTVALLLTGLAFALLGQYYFSYRREFYRDGIVFYALAVILFVIGWRRTTRQTAHTPAPRRPWRERVSLHTLAAVGGTALSLLAGWLAVRRPAGRDFADLLWMWLIGNGWFLAAFLPPLPVDWRERAFDWLRRNRTELVRLAVLAAVALIVRAVALGQVPRNLGGDEGTWGIHGLAMLQDGRLANPFATRWFDFPSMSFLVWGVSMRIWGDTVAGLRAISAIIGAATVLTTFLLVREMWGKRPAWLAAAVLAFQHYHIHFSRLAVNNVADGLFLTLAFWLLVRGLRTGGKALFALSGAVLGLSWYGYAGARLMPVILAIYVGWRGLTERGFFRRHGPHLALVALAALIVVLPLGFHYLRYPNTLASRYQQVSIFASGWLEREQVITGRSAASLMLQQIWKSVSAFHYTVDPTFWYHPDVPLLDFASGVLVIVGLVLATLRMRPRSDGLLLLWFWLAITFGWILNENPPSSQRLVIGAPALAILVALGGEALLEWGRRLLGGRPIAWARVAAVVLGAIVAFNLGFYFFDYAPRRIYGNPTAEMSTVLSDVLHAQDEVPPIYFDGAPYIYWNFGTLAFRLRGFEGIDWTPEAPVEIDLERGALFFVHAARLDDLVWIQERYPDGDARAYYSDDTGHLMFVTYLVPPRR